MGKEFTKVKVIGDEEATGPAVEVFGNFQEKLGKVPNWARVMANRPEILAGFAKLLSGIMGPGLVEEDNKWKVAYKVSEINKCTYCVGVAKGMLTKLGAEEEDIKNVSENVENMNDDEKIAIKYAEAVTKDAVNIPDDIFEELKKHYDDAQIVELTSAIGLFNYINRFNDALGVMPE